MNSTPVSTFRTTPPTQEDYVEYSRQGTVLKGLNKAVVRSRYEEDVLEKNHTVSHLFGGGGVRMWAGGGGGSGGGGGGGGVRMWAGGYSSVFCNDG